MIKLSIGSDGKVEISSGADRPERPNKGKSLLEAIQNFIVVDLETTGLDPRWDDIIEVAAIRIIDGDVAEHFQSLVNPGYEIDDFIVELTGITNEMISTAPQLGDVFPQFIDFLGDAIVIGHNANFDVNFIYDNCSNLSLPDFKNDFIDTMRLSRRLFKEHSHHRLVDLVNCFGIADDIEHRALSDAVKTYKCYMYMKNYAADHEIEFASLYPSKQNASAKHIQAETSDFDESTPIYGKLFVFTGVLSKMVRKEAMQLVINMGGQCGDNVTTGTNYLVLGNNEYCKTIKDGKSNKQKKAEKLKLSGHDIETISEDVFYDMLVEVDI